MGGLEMKIRERFGSSGGGRGTGGAGCQGTAGVAHGGVDTALDPLAILSVGPGNDSRHVIGCHSTQKTRVQSALDIVVTQDTTVRIALDDVASNVRQSPPC